MTASATEKNVKASATDPKAPLPPVDAPATPDAAEENATGTEETTEEAMSLETATGLLENAAASVEPTDPKFPLYSMVTGMWALTKGNFAKVAELAEKLRKVTVTDTQIREAIKVTKNAEIVAERDRIAAIEEQIAKDKQALHLKVRDILRGNTYDEETEKNMRAEFDSNKLAVTSYVQSMEGVVFQGVAQEDDDIWNALQVVKEGAPKLRGSAVRFARHMTGGENADHVRDWVKANRSDLVTSEKGRLSDAAKAAHREGCQDCKDRVAAQVNGAAAK
jgi:hypothetical protein